MAERWQLWMPFHIDRFKGSPHVQAMRSAARSGYLYLLSAMWQTPDCTLPHDQEELQVLSGLMEDEWEQYGRTILRRFTVDGDRVTNAVLRTEWLDAKRVFDARSASGRETSAKRSAHGDHNGDRKVTTQSPSRRADTRTLTLTGTETLQETSPTPPVGGVKKNSGRKRPDRDPEVRNALKPWAGEASVGMYGGEEPNAESVAGTDEAAGETGTDPAAELLSGPVVRDAGGAERDVRDGGTPGGEPHVGAGGAASARVLARAPASLSALHRQRVADREPGEPTPVAAVLRQLAPNVSLERAPVSANAGVQAARNFLDELHDEFARGFGMSPSEASKRPGWEDPLEAWQRCFEHVGVGGVEMDGDRTVVYLETQRPKDLVDGLQRYKAKVSVAMRKAFGHEVQLVPRDERTAA